MSPSTVSSISVSSELVGERERGGVDLGAADHEDALGLREQRERLLERRGALGAVGVPGRIAGDDDVPSPRQRPEAVGNRIPGSPAHDDRVAHRELRKCATSSGSRHGIVFRVADHAAARERSDQRDGHTATCARMAGVMLVADHLEVLERVVEDRLRPAAEDERGIGVRRALELGLDLLTVVVVDVAVAAGPDRARRPRDRTAARACG